jgi:hypothetical protein
MATSYERGWNDAIDRFVDNPFRLRAADRLAYACAQAIQRGTIHTRSAVDDALLAYLDIGGLDGPRDVPTWMAQYEAAQAAKEENTHEHF